MAKHRAIIPTVIPQAGAAGHADRLSQARCTQRVAGAKVCWDWFCPKHNATAYAKAGGSHAGVPN